MFKHTVMPFFSERPFSTSAFTLLVRPNSSPKEPRNLLNPVLPKLESLLCFGFGTLG